MNRRTATKSLLCLLGAAVALIAGAPARGQERLPVTPSPQETVLPRLFDPNLWADPSDNDRPTSPWNRGARLFGIPGGPLSGPLGAGLEGEAAAGDPDALGSGGGGSDQAFQAAMWSDNPYFDLRRPGDIGGPGFYKIHSQLHLFDTDHTGCKIGFQAVTPAGLEFDGVADGPTVLSPNLALVHELTDETAIQGFVEKSVRMKPHWDDHFGNSLHYGIAVEHRLPTFDALTLAQVHLFLEALGRYRVEGDNRNGPPAVWELVPGLHWRMGENWWMSGGVIVPLTTPRSETGLWQVTCSWQF